MIPNNDTSLYAMFIEGDKDNGDRMAVPILAWDSNGNAWCLGEKRLVRAIDYVGFEGIGEYLADAGDYLWHVDEDHPTA